MWKANGVLNDVIFIFLRYTDLDSRNRPEKKKESKSEKRQVCFLLRVIKE